jgi:hypothetical protein
VVDTEMVLPNTDALNVSPLHVNWVYKC